MKRWILRICLLLLILVPSFAMASSSDDTSLLIPSGNTESGDIATVSRSITIDGVVEGDVTSVTGSIVVRGSVEGDVISLFGDVTFEPQAVAGGNVMAGVGHVNLPSTVQHPASIAVFSGDLSNQGMASLLPGFNGQTLGLSGRIATIFALGVLGVVIAVLIGLLWPRSIASAAKASMLATDRAIGLGMVWLVLEFVLVALIAVVLILTLVGMALLPFVILLAQIPFLVGLAVIGRGVGSRMNLHGPLALIAGAAVLLAPGLVLSIISLTLAFFYFYIVGSVGIGGLILLRSSVAYRHSAQA